MDRAITFSMKVIPVLPSPCKMLDMVEDKYRKGHMKLKVAMKLEAKGLSNICFPAKSLMHKKKIVQKIPKQELKRIAVWVILFNFSRFFSS